LAQPASDDDFQVAIAAARSAAYACRAVQEELVRAHTLEKKDKSPVTVADFASQAIVCATLEEVFPKDSVVGEESAAALREKGQGRLRRVITEQVSARFGRPLDEVQVLDWIDRGNGHGDSNRYWTLDPIDGTKGFLRGEQYAVALALLVDREVELGVLACPNLPLNGDGEERGALFAARRGAPARVYPLWDDADCEGRPISVAAIDSPADARFCESVESGHSDQSESARVAQILGIASEPVRLDSQCKYATVARGDASIYLRLPTRKDYQEKIWDHAAGMIVVEAAGGRVTDIDGKPLDFRHGPVLAENRGVVATSGDIHDAVIDAIAQASAAR